MVISEIHFFGIKHLDIFRRPSHLNSYQSTTLEYKFGIFGEFILESYYVFMLLCILCYYVLITLLESYYVAH